MRLLPHSQAAIMQWVLVEKSLGTDYRLELTWPVYAVGEPPGPDNVITTYDTTGISHGSVMTGGPDDGELQGNYGFQVRVRARNHPTGWNKIQLIRATLAQNCINVLVTVPVFGTIPAQTYLVQNIANLGDCLSLGKDIVNSKTNLFTLNGVVSVDMKN